MKVEFSSHLGSAMSMYLWGAWIKVPATISV
jgi:hypothetical protein